MNPRTVLNIIGNRIPMGAIDSLAIPSIDRSLVEPHPGVVEAFLKPPALEDLESLGAGSPRGPEDPKHAG